MIRSQTAEKLGIENIPSLSQLCIIKNLANNFFQPLRNHFNLPIKINSFYRCKELNNAIGGSKYSDHMVNDDVAAIDIDDTYSQQYGVYNRHIFNHIAHNMDYYKLIYEYEDKVTPCGLKSPKWIHISYSTDPRKNKQKTTLYTNGDGYKPLKLDMI